MDSNIWNKVIELANKSLKYDDVPIGALIVKNGEIIGEGYNTREKNQDVMGHAEINAIKMASRKLNNWNLSGCSLYVSLKPCSMCLEIIKQSRISNVYYLLDKPLNKKEFSKTIITKDGNSNLENEYANILSDFFAKLREK